jgi:DNA-binding response OmpR family regulator
MRKHLILFIQPEMARHFDFMKLYESGLITDWVRDTKAAQSQLTSFVDAVVLDLREGVAECVDFCIEAKRRRGDRIVVLLHGDSASPPTEACIDMVMPKNVSQDEFVTRMLTLMRTRQRRAAG